MPSSRLRMSATLRSCAWAVSKALSGATVVSVIPHLPADVRGSPPRYGQGNWGVAQGGSRQTLGAPLASPHLVRAAEPWELHRRNPVGKRRTTENSQAVLPRDCHGVVARHGAVPWHERLESGATAERVDGLRKRGRRNRAHDVAGGVERVDAER